MLIFSSLCSVEKGVELDCNWVEFGDIRYHIQVSQWLGTFSFHASMVEREHCRPVAWWESCIGSCTLLIGWSFYSYQDVPKKSNGFCKSDLQNILQASIKSPHLLLLSVSLPTPPPETVFFGGLPLGAIEAVKAAYGPVIQILDPPRDCFNLTVKLNLTKLPPDEGLVSLFWWALEAFYGHWLWWNIQNQFEYHFHLHCPSFFVASWIVFGSISFFVFCYLFWVTTKMCRKFEHWRTLDVIKRKSHAKGYLNRALDNKLDITRLATW